MQYKASSEVSRQALIQAGLTAHQAAIYEALIQHGSQKATKVAFLSSVPRTLSYKVLDELAALSLVVKKDEPGKVSVFTAAHPLKLKELADRRLDEAKNAKVALEGTLSAFISDFNTVSGQPGVRILEGVKGIEEMLEDQLNEGQPVFLIRSPLDLDTPQLKTVMDRHVAERIKLRIPVRSIVPFEEFYTRAFLSQDKERFVERKIVPQDALPVPASVAIYANKVAITAYKGGTITTIIENVAIKDTFKLIFEFIWNSRT